MLTRRLSFKPETAQIFRQSHTRPMPRVQEGQQLNDLGVPACIDISDGLVADLSHICESSSVSAIVKETSLPVHPLLMKEFGKTHMDLILGGGEDYELIFAAPPAVMAEAIEALPCKVTIIGEIADRQSDMVMIMDADGTVKPQALAGWDHFKTQ